jgi:6-phosphogluconolactonase
MTKIFDTPEALANQFAEDFYKKVEISYCEGKLLHVALSGGSTPKILFKVLREKYHSLLHWENIHFYWGDERMVAPESPESNYGEAKRILFDHIKIPNDNIHPIWGDHEVEIETSRYARLLEHNLVNCNGFPTFDLIILGMGDDGHTASIFPDQMVLLKSQKLVEPAMHPISKQERITMTGPVINNAHEVVFLVTGKEKASVLDKILNKKDNFLDYPTAHINPTSGNLVFYLDRQAMSSQDLK